MEEFDWEEENISDKPVERVQDSNKIVVTVGGGKGEGKTATAMGFPGKISYFEAAKEANSPPKF